MTDTLDDGAVRLLGGTVRAIHREAPPVWSRAIFTAEATTGSVRHGLRYETAAGPGEPVFLDPDADALFDLAEVMAAPHGWQLTNIDLTCRPSGEFEIVAADDGLRQVKGPGPGHIGLPADGALRHSGRISGP